MKRTVVFYRDVSSATMIFAWVLDETDSVEYWKERHSNAGKGEILLCVKEIDIPEIDTRQEEIDALERSLEIERGNFQARMDSIQERISNLRYVKFAEGGTHE